MYVLDEITDGWTQLALQLKHNLIEIGRWLLVNDNRNDSITPFSEK